MASKKTTRKRSGKFFRKKQKQTENLKSAVSTRSDLLISKPAFFRSPKAILPLVHSGHARRELLRHQGFPRNARLDLAGELGVQGAKLCEALDAVVEAVGRRKCLDRSRDTNERVRVFPAGGDEAAVPDQDICRYAVCGVDGGDLGRERVVVVSRREGEKVDVVRFFLSRTRARARQSSEKKRVLFFRPAPPSHLLLDPGREHGIVKRQGHPGLPTVPERLRVAPDGEPLVPHPKELVRGRRGVAPQLRHPGLLREQGAIAGAVGRVGVPAAPDVVGHGGVGAHDAGGGGLDGDAGAAVFLEEREKR
jgi:hypothetical protein